MFIHGNHDARGKNHDARGKKRSSCLCDVCFASKESSEWEFFVPVGTHLAITLLIHSLNN